MKQGVRILGILFLGMLAAAFLAACGGGGDGGGVPTPSGLVYNGVTTAAVINAATAEELALAAYEGGQMGSESSDLVPLAVDDGGSTGISLPIEVSSILSQTIADAVLAGSQVSAEVAFPPDTVPGLCGDGSYTMNLNIDIATGTFYGSVVYDAYCMPLSATENMVTDGTVTFSQTMDFETFEETMTINFKSLTSEVLDSNTSAVLESATLSGSITTVTNSVGEMTQTINFVAKNNVSGEMAKVKDYTINITLGSDGGGNYFNVTVGGKFFHAKHGYVTLSTSTALKIYDGSDTPASGMLVLTGAGGTIELTFIDETSYQVVAKDDLGTVIFDSGVKYWL